MLTKQVLAIIGDSGAGKTSLSKELVRLNNYPLLACRDLGNALAMGKYNCHSFEECLDLPNSDQYIDDLNKKIVSCVLNKFRRMDGNILIFDDLILIDAVRMLQAKGVDVKIYLLNTPYEIRIKRIMERECCTYQDAVSEEQKKVLTKKRLGINDVKKIKYYKLDGAKPIDKILEVFSSSIRVIEH